MIFPRKIPIAEPFVENQRRVVRRVEKNPKFSDGHNTQFDRERVIGFQRDRHTNPCRFRATMGCDERRETDSVVE